MTSRMDAISCSTLPSRRSHRQACESHVFVRCVPPAPRYAASTSLPASFTHTTCTTSGSVFWKVTSTSTPPLSDASRRFLRAGHHRRAKARGGGGSGGGSAAAELDGRLFVLSVCCCEGSRGGWCACGCIEGGCAAVRGCAADRCAPSGRSANASSEYVDRRKVDAFSAAAAASIAAATVPVASTPLVRVDSFFAASTAAFGTLPPTPPPARPSV